MFGHSAAERRLAAQLAELERDYFKQVEQNAVAWQEAARLGRTLAQYDMRAKARVDADTRLRAAEDQARVAMARQQAMEAFWTGLINGEYDEGQIPAPTLPIEEYEEDEDDGSVR